MVRRLCFYFFSISDSGETRIAHNKGARVAARLLQATGRKMVSECQEEGDVVLPDGRTVTYNTSTCTYDDRLGVSLCAFIDAAAVTLARVALSWMFVVRCRDVVSLRLRIAYDICMVTLFYSSIK